MIPILHISDAVWQDIRTHILACFPEEACGVIGGRHNMAIRVFPVTNQLHSAVAFHMDAKEQLDAFIEMEKNTLDLTAIFHSHPGGPDHPSETDVDQNYYYDIVHLICFPNEKSDWGIKGFIIDKSEVTQIELIWDDCS